MPIRREPQEYNQHTSKEAKSKFSSIEINQDILKARIERYKPNPEIYYKRPYLVWTDMPSKFVDGKNLTEQESVPEALRKLGPADNTTYTSEELNEDYQNGGIIIQTDGKGGLETYPVEIKDINKNKRLSSVTEALELNPELAKLIAKNPNMETLMQGKSVIGMIRSAPAKMIKFSNIGYDNETEIVLPGMGVGQKNLQGKMLIWVSAQIQPAKKNIGL
jgi:hypothetical protein